jgi:cytoskeletal protein CcmA (bactofilin family)
MTGLERARHEREEYDSLLERLRQETGGKQEGNGQAEISLSVVSEPRQNVEPVFRQDQKDGARVARMTGNGNGHTARNEWGESMDNSANDILGSDGDSAGMPDVNRESPGPQFYAGPGLKLKGEITGCDTFKVEGDVEGKVSAQHLHLSPTGKFVGTADVQDAAVEGKFDGTLNVAGRLLVRSSGRVSGKIVYGQIEIECGGEILGEVSPRASDSEISLNGSGPKEKRSAPVLSVAGGSSGSASSLSAAPADGADKSWS